MSAPLVIQNLGIAFGAAQVVRDVSLTVRAGETLALVGESGSGKSVTAFAAMGLLPQTARQTGSILLSGQEVVGRPEKTLRAMRGRHAGMIFQEPMTSLNPVMRVGAQVMEVLRCHDRLSRGEARRQAARLFEQVHIPVARFNDYPHMFSGGMRQRVMIAMALAARPRLLIADEPTTALDVTVQAEILKLLADIQRTQDTAILLITHDMGVAAQMADRIAVMRHGRIVEQSDAATVLRTPGDGYTRALMAAVPRPGMQTKPPPAPAKAPPLLMVNNLVTRFAGACVNAVDDVSFELGRGETLALVGESGCGKTTTGRSLLRLTEPLRGQVVLDGTDILASPPYAVRRARQRMQIVFQDPQGSLDPRQTIGSALCEPMRVHGAGAGEARARAAALLAQVGLEPSCAGRRPHEFSGGQRQRIAIARALALKPRLVIADEAVSALDVTVKAQIVELMLALQQSEGLSWLFISHDMAVVERISHRIAVMRAGRIVEIGPRAEVIGNPQHSYTRRLLAAVPVADPACRGRFPAMPAPPPMPPSQNFRSVAPGHLVAEEG